MICASLSFMNSCMFGLCLHSTRASRGCRGYCYSADSPWDFDRMSPRTKTGGQIAGTVMSNVTRPSSGNFQYQCSNNEEVTRGSALTIEASSMGRVIESAIPLVFGLFGWLVRKVIPVRGVAMFQKAARGQPLTRAYCSKGYSITIQETVRDCWMASYQKTSVEFMGISSEYHGVTGCSILAGLGGQETPIRTLSVGGRE